MQGHAQGEGASRSSCVRVVPVRAYANAAKQISVHVADVKQVLRVYSIEVAAREKDDLNEDPIVIKLRKVRALVPPIPLPVFLRSRLPVFESPRC